MNVSQIQELLKYNSKTGQLTWKARTEKHIAMAKVRNNWNTRFAGKPAFTSIDTKGYLRGSISNKNYRAHRVAWVLYHGSEPDGVIDHINGDTTDNRICNLRCVSQRVNMSNMKIRSDSTSGVRGVSETAQGNWRAYITTKGKTKRLGTYKTIDEAKSARLKAENALGFITRSQQDSA